MKSANKCLKITNLVSYALIVKINYDSSILYSK